MNCCSYHRVGGFRHMPCHWGPERYPPDQRRDLHGHVYLEIREQDRNGVRRSPAYLSGAAAP